MEDNSKIIEKIRSLSRQAESETLIGNEGAGALFADKARELLLKHKLDESVLVTEKAENYIPPTPNLTVIDNPYISKKGVRIAWFEELAKVVANGYYCATSINPITGQLSIYGYNLDRNICEQVILSLAKSADFCCNLELPKAKARSGQSYNDLKFRIKLVYPIFDKQTFIDSFHYGFREKIRESYGISHETAPSKEVLEFADLCMSYRERNIVSIPQNLSSEAAKVIGGIKAQKPTNNSTSMVKKATLKTKNNVLSLEDKLNSKEREVFILIDNSGSMDWQSGSDKSPMDEAKEGSIEFYKDAKEKGYKIGLISFESHAELLTRPTLDTDYFETVVNKMKPMGGTNLLAAFEKAEFEFTKGCLNKTIMIVTDGQPTNPEEEVIRYAARLRALGIEIMAIGTSGARQELLDKLVSRKDRALLVGGGQLSLGIRKMAGLLSA